MDRELSTEFEEKVIKINRVAKVQKGGRKFGFNAIIVIGNNSGQVGLGFGKANEVPDAIRKASNDARKNIFNIPIVNETIPFEAVGKCEKAKVLLKPAKPGTGIVAGSSIRAILEVSGIKNIVTKSLGSNSSVNLSKATLDGLRKISSIMHSISLRKEGKIGIGNEESKDKIDKKRDQSKEEDKTVS